MPGAELWASEVERLANALATLAICGAGIAAALVVQRAVRSRLPAAVAVEGLGDLEATRTTVEPEGDEPVADPVAGEPANP